MGPAVAAYPDYAENQKNQRPDHPVFVLTPLDN